MRSFVAAQAKLFVSMCFYSHEFFKMVHKNKPDSIHLQNNWYSEAITNKCPFCILLLWPNPYFCALPVINSVQLSAISLKVELGVKF